ncbi:MAG: HDOD domain-containing protein [Desulfomonilia bacterium]|nr:HDOD domain-containing protein [Desulfomonilia bacterium]
METTNIVWILLYGGICIMVLFLLYTIVAREKKPTLKKSPARFVSVSDDDQVGTYLDVYNLDWKPSRQFQDTLPPEVEHSIEKIETISPLINELSARLNDPDINPQDISKLIITDQGLTSYILKRVNSPYYGLVQKVYNIFNAIVILGYNEIYRIVMEERARKIGIQPNRAEWVHANITSTIGAHLAGSSRSGIQNGTMVTLGMLHDIGKTIMLQSLPEPPEGFPDDPRERLKKEVDLYGIDHATLGGIIAKRWRMPQRLCSCIEKHHWPMFWPLREVGKISPENIRELALLSISDVAARNFTGEITGPYIGDDYYRFIKKLPKMESILVPEITRDLNRIKRFLPENEES